MPSRYEETANRAERSFFRHLDLAPDDEVVDLWCGDTELAAAVAGKIPRGRLTLLTQDESMKRTAEARLKEMNASRVTVVAAAGAGELPAGRFHLAYLVVRPYLSNALLADLLAGARWCLRPGGRLMLFASQRHGAPTVLRRAAEIFGEVAVLDKPGGTRIARCIAGRLSEEAGDPPEDERAEGEVVTLSMHGHEFSFLTAHDLFSRGEVDAGTRLLLDTVKVEPADDLLDLGCGYGAVGIIAARQARDGRATLVDTHVRAVRFALRNITLNGISNATAQVSDGLSALAGRRFSLVLSNPPLHSAPGTLERLTAEAFSHLKPAGRLAYVVHKAYDARPILEAVFSEVETLIETEEYRVIGAGRRDRPA